MRPSEHAQPVIQTAQITAPAVEPVDAMGAVILDTYLKHQH